MSVVNMAKNIKKIHPNFLIFYKVGSFIQCFGKDTYIVWQLFGYQIKEMKDGIPTCGFPSKAMPKVCAKLERQKINYMFIDTRNNYDVDEKVEYDNLNKYDEILEVAHNQAKIKKRIEKIEEALMSEMGKPAMMKKLEKIEEIVYESREIQSNTIC